MTPEPLTCVICGVTPWQQGDVAMALIRWRDGDQRFGAGPRCKDIEACRKRLADNGEEWPLLEAWAEVRAANLERLGEMLREKGLVS